MKRKILIPLFTISVSLGFSTAMATDDTTVEWICDKYAQRVTNLFCNINLSPDDMRPVRNAVEKKDWPAACRALVAYYRHGNSASWLREMPITSSKSQHERAENILRDMFTFYNDTRKVPRLKDGRLNWHPTNDIEWNSALHRHDQITTLLIAYRETGDLKYVRALDQHIRDWVLSNPYTGERNDKPMAWYGLEPGFRLSRWARIFYGLQQVDSFTSAARILMLSSISDHANFLMEYGRNVGGNVITTQMYGLESAALCWPEFKNAANWYDHAFIKMNQGMTAQVYPDGVQKELTSHYHKCALIQFKAFADLAEKAGKTVPKEYKTQLERMWNYLAFSIRPDGYGVLNNDSNRDFSRSDVLRYAKTFHRPDWTYIASNGREGEKPNQGPSIVFPYAGQVIMRSGWDADAHWTFFDVGPYGSGHQHKDKLHLSIAAFGRDILVDSGRFSYTDCRRGYFRGSQGHNVILVDGNGQKPGVNTWQSPMEGNYAIQPKFDFARGSFESGFDNIDDKVVHRRAVVYLRGRYWLVVDRISLESPHTITALWHFHPECSVKVKDITVLTDDAGKGNLSISPVSDFSWKVKIVKGQTSPMQGWWSREYNHIVESDCAVYSARLEETSTFAWIFFPSKGPSANMKAAIIEKDEKHVRVNVQVSGEKAMEIVVPLKDGISGIKEF